MGPNMIYCHLEGIKHPGLKAFNIVRYELVYRPPTVTLKGYCCVFARKEDAWFLKFNLIGYFQKHPQFFNRYNIDLVRHEDNQKFTCIVSFTYTNLEDVTRYHDGWNVPDNQRKPIIRTPFIPLRDWEEDKYCRL
jgi:hypothetical protein